MNYSIILTEIRFLSRNFNNSATIIQIIHMMFWIMPEFDREGWSVCLSWRQTL